MARWQRDPKARQRLIYLLAAVEGLALTACFHPIFSAYAHRVNVALNRVVSDVVIYYLAFVATGVWLVAAAGPDCGQRAAADAGAAMVREESAGQRFARHGRCGCRAVLAVRDPVPVAVAADHVPTRHAGRRRAGPVSPDGCLRNLRLFLMTAPDSDR